MYTDLMPGLIILSIASVTSYAAGLILMYFACFKDLKQPYTPLSWRIGVFIVGLSVIMTGSLTMSVVITVFGEMSKGLTQ